MNAFINKILLNDKIEFNGSVEDLKRKLNESKGRKYNLDWISNTSFEFFSKFSLGTLQASGLAFKVDGIKGFGIIEEQDDKVVIHLSTELRVELYFILGVLTLFFITSFFVENKFPIWLYQLMPLALIFLWGVYRFQEVLLFKRVKKHLEN